MYSATENNAPKNSSRFRHPHILYGGPPSFWPKFDHYAPSYANAPMYGASRDVPHHYYQNDYQAPPAMTSYYSDDGYGGYDQFGYGQPAQQYVPTTEIQERIRNCKNPMGIQEIIVGLEQLLQGGEDFDVWAGAIRGRLASNMTDDCKRLAVQIACEMAVSVPPNMFSKADHQPQYVFAKLIGYVASDNNNFTSVAVMPNLEALYTSYGQFNQEKRANLLMFFAELHNRLETKDGKKIAILGDAVIMQMNDCLKTPTDDSMKLLIQVLKLSGPDLDSSPKGYEQMNDLLTRVNGYAYGHPKLSESVKAQMLDVVDQRTKGWGRANAIMGANGSSVFLTEAEEAFLDNCIDNGESSSLNQSFNDPDTSLDEADVMNEFNSFVQEEDNQFIEANDAALANMMDNLKVEQSKTPTEEPSAPPPSS